MKKPNYDERLRKFARTLQNFDIVAHLYDHSRSYSVAKDEETGVIYFDWVFNFLPKVFSRYWSYGGPRRIYLHSHYNTNLLVCFQQFFGLTNDELFALLVPGYGYEELQPMPPHASLGDLANQIYILIDKHENEKTGNESTTPAEVGRVFGVRSSIEYLYRNRPNKSR